MFAPGVDDAADKRTLVAAVDRPLNVLPRATTPSVEELTAIGVSRISTGGSRYWAATSAVVHAARELRDLGTYDYWGAVPEKMTTARAAFSA